MKCGNCHLDHETVQQVKDCYGPSVVAGVDQMTIGKNGKRGQYELIQDLLAERDMTPLPPYEEARFKITKRQASEMIDDLIKNVPRTKSRQRDGKQLAIIPVVPEGFYAVPDESKQNDFVFLRVDRPEAGEWAGYTFGHQIIGGQPNRKIGFDRLTGILKQITDLGILESGMLFSLHLKKCRHCGRHLTKYASRALSAGPDCAEQHGYGALWVQIQYDWESANGKDAEVPEDVQQVRPTVAPTLSTAGRSPRTSGRARPAGAVRGSSKRAS